MTTWGDGGGTSPLLFIVSHKNLSFDTYEAICTNFLHDLRTC